MVKRQLKALGRWLVARGAVRDLKVFVDTAPVMEKPLAEAAGIGWQGKHTNLVSREHGSWLFLGAIYTTLDLTPDAAGGATLRVVRRVPAWRARPMRFPRPIGSMRGGASRT